MVRQNHAAIRRFRARPAAQLFHQISIRQTVEAVVPQSLRLKAARQWQLLRHPGHGVMKSRVETSKLGQVRMALLQRFNEGQLAG